MDVEDGPPFLDTNLLLYAVMPTGGLEAAKTAVARHFLLSPAVISVQVLNEFANVALRKLRRSPAQVRASLADLALIFLEPVVLTLDLHRAALDLHERHGFTFYGALIVATAVQAGCSMLLTEDLQDGMVVAGRLTIRSPFR